VDGRRNILVIPEQKAERGKGREKREDHPGKPLNNMIRDENKRGSVWESRRRRGKRLSSFF